MSNTSPKTTRKVKAQVYADVDCGCDHSPSPKEQQINASIDFWTGIICISLVGIFGAMIAWGFGWLDSPDQKLMDKNAELAEQLADVESRLSQMESCLNNVRE